MLKIGVLISGGGSNLQSIIDEINKGNIKGEIDIIISNKKDAYGLTRGRDNKIDTKFINPKDFIDNDEYNREIIKELDKRNIDLVVLAGYLKILSKEFTSKYKNRIINIHPSLIPSFCGDGCYGENVHRQVIEYGVRYSGATVHFVDEGTDTGPIILQKVVDVKSDDSISDLQNRVLKVEHEILPEAVKLFCEGRIVVEDRTVKII